MKRAAEEAAARAGRKAKGPLVLRNAGMGLIKQDSEDTLMVIHILSPRTRMNCRSRRAVPNTIQILSREELTEKGSDVHGRDQGHEEAIRFFASTGVPVQTSDKKIERPPQRQTSFAHHINSTLRYHNAPCRLQQ